MDVYEVFKFTVTVLLLGNFFFFCDAVDENNGYDINSDPDLQFLLANNDGSRKLIKFNTPLAAFKPEDQKALLLPFRIIDDPLLSDSVEARKHLSELMKSFKQKFKDSGKTAEELTDAFRKFDDGKIGRVPTEKFMSMLPTLNIGINKKKDVDFITQAYDIHDSAEVAYPTFIKDLARPY